MVTFEKLYSMGHEQVVFFSDPSCNLKAIVAIHNTTLGPALGGTRMWNYGTIDEAIEDARKAIIAKYKSIEAKLLKGERVRDPDETIWVSMCHYIASNTRGRVRQGEEQSIQSTRDPNYKGPIFG